MARRHPFGLSHLLVGIGFCLTFGGVAAGDLVPALTGAVSRKFHAGVAYDVPLALTGAGAIEGRALNGAPTIVLLFDQPVNGGTAAVTAGKGLAAGTPNFSGNAMSVGLTGVANAQAVTLTVSNVTTPAGGTLASASVTLRLLEGDVNGNGSVTAADVNTVKAQIGKPVSGFSYRSDLNFNNTITTAADVAIVKARVGTSVAGGPMDNTAPLLTELYDQEGIGGQAGGTIGVAISDAETAPAAMGVAAVSSDPLLVPASGIVLAGTGPNRTLTITPAAGRTGTATITVSVSDGLLITSDTFVLTVLLPPKLYVAQLRPENATVQTGGSGIATLLVSGDETWARLSFTFSNLTTPLTAHHIHGPADPGQAGGIIFDIDAATPNEMDGSYRWDFVQTGNTTVDDIRTAIRAGRTYINLHTSRYPNGEIRGHFNLATGTQTFTPPASPPPLPGGSPTLRDAHRFLRQATYGPTTQSVPEVQAMGFDAWITSQFDAPRAEMPRPATRPASTQPATQPVEPEPTTMPATMTAVLNLRRDTLQAQVPPATLQGSPHVFDAWWQLSCTAPDQLRQRVAFAYSQIFVISYDDGDLQGQPFGLAAYYDLMLADAFVNFRQILEDVTLNPGMGVYLDMRGNRRSDPTRGTVPNENYAREVLQLFSIGLNLMHPDGTLKVDARGLPIPTYNQDVVVNFSHVFTGWDWYQTANPPSNNPARNYTMPMTLIPSRHSTIQKNLLSYTGNYATGSPDRRALPAGQSGTLDLRDALDNIFNHPNVGPFIARRLIQQMVCSNPSPGYIYRVAEKFNDNGQGVRGDMKAVIRAVLTDYEARSVDILVNQGYGKQIEPILRTTVVLRALSATSASGFWRMNSTNADLSQTPLRAPTVFNFFEPDYTQPGVLADNGLSAPEFQITTETQAIASSNFMRQGTGTTGFKIGDIKILYTNETPIASNSQALVDRLDILLTGGALTPAMKARIVTYVNTLPLTDRPKHAAQLIATSPEYCAMR